MPDQRTIDGLTMLSAEPATPSRAPLLFIHGYFATAWVFGRYLDYFAKLGHPCVAVNLRGRAGSRPDVDIGSASMADFVDDASRVAREMDHPVVIGHSMGGLVAQKLAEQGSARALVLMSSAPPHGISVFTFELVRRQWRYLPAILFSRAVVARQSDFSPLVLNRIPPDKQDEMFSHFVPDSGRAAREMMMGSVHVDEGQVRCPVLTIASEDDHFIPASTVRRIASKYGSSLHVARAHGHLVMQEPGWEETAHEIASWVDRQSTSLLSPGGAT